MRALGDRRGVGGANASVLLVAGLIALGAGAGMASAAAGGHSKQAPALHCARGDAKTHYQTEVRVTIRCHGAVRPLRVGNPPDSGRLRKIDEHPSPHGRVLTAIYRPKPLFAGRDLIAVVARGSGGTIRARARITVMPWRMRAMGDSVTAGFGYYGDGKLMSVEDLLYCKPAAVVSNRCSSNSDEGPGYTGPPEWNQDFGLSNNVSWAAQFANTWHGGGHITAPQMFQNRAVTGSAPSDWLPGGILNGQLKSIVAQDPELVAMTLGANPLLSDLLLSTEGEECAIYETVAELQSCLAPFFTQVKLTQSLQQVYTALLQAPDSQVVVFEYNLSIPSLNLFSTWQLEAMIDYFNSQIATAVANTKAALPASQASRLLLISAQTDPITPDPLKLPRFDIGTEPTIHDTWTAGFDCGGDDWVDGPSVQSTPTQVELRATDPLSFCPGESPPWIINADSGIHPSRLGYAQYAQTLTNVLTAQKLVPLLP